MNEKNLPSNFVKETQYLAINYGSNWNQPNKITFYNNLPYFHEKNKEAIEAIYKLDL